MSIYVDLVRFNIECPNTVSDAALVRNAIDAEKAREVADRAAFVAQRAYDEACTAYNIARDAETIASNAAYDTGCDSAALIKDFDISQRQRGM